MRGSGYIIAGHGRLKMHGSPRLYIAGIGDSTDTYHGSTGGGWENVEMTVYARFVSDGVLKSYSGLTLVARSNHNDYKENACSASGYYARIYKSTGQAAFIKEYYHNASTGTVYAPSRRKQIPEFTSGLTLGVWVGLKFVVRTIQRADASVVQLDLYYDLMDGLNGGRWELLHSYTDEPGAWTPSSGKTVPRACASAVPPIADGDVVLGSRDSCFLRSDGNNDTEVHWKRLSIRRIDTAGPVAGSLDGNGSNCTSHAPMPTAFPTFAPTEAPTNAPTDAPTNAPTNAPLFQRCFSCVDGLTARQQIEANFGEGSIESPSYMKNREPCNLNFTHIRCAPEPSWAHGEVFKFYLDLDKDCEPVSNAVGKQRNEIKVFSKSDDSLKGLYGSTMRYSWKFKVNSTMRVSKKFTHIFQMKFVGGDSSKPAVTFTGATKSGID
eukprot:g2877.t1